MSDLVIECRAVSKSYASKAVLRDVSLEVTAGGFVGLVGMNGSGKTTLLKTLLDLTACDNGNIELFGRSHRVVTAREDIAYLPDRFAPPAYLRCKDFLKYMLELHGCDYDQEKVIKIFNELELEPEILTASVQSLSKGMTQKLGLIACLLSEKKLLILDEPMSGLDPRARVLVKQQLVQLKKRGVSVFFSSHALTDVAEIADDMVVLHVGKVLYTGTPAEFIRQQQANDLEQAYMNCLSQVSTVTGL